jgi:hypothetical protein
VSDLHPMAETVPMIIEAMGVKHGVHWWMKYAHAWPSPEALRMSVEAVEAMARDDVNYIVCADDGEQMARAFQWVRLFDLAPFVEACRAQTA